MVVEPVLWFANQFLAAQTLGSKQKTLQFAREVFTPLLLPR